jgi:peptide methionine sulfoxide reductase msrA/msrB
MIHTLVSYKGTVLILLFVIAIVGGFWWSNSQARQTQREVQNQLSETESVNKKTAVLAGGCFWCVEADMEKAPGVIKVVSGYSGGDGSNPTYETYAQKGHREVVKVTYLPEEITYRQLLFYFLKHIDPTDGSGSFVDRGEQYSPAIYYQTDNQKTTAKTVLQDISEAGNFSEPLKVPVLERQKFWRAEDYHQNFYKKNPFRYKTYRAYSGRDDFIEKHWGDTADKLPDRVSNAENKTAATDKSWRTYEKPSRGTLRQRLPSRVFDVTQNDSTEPAYKNELWDETRPGIYVDRLSGEPLFSSQNKYKSGTGWPSFTKPLESANIKTQPDYVLGYRRTEVRSRYGDNHLGHVFNDGPETLEASGGAEPTGLRYCLNSAALRFIPREDLKEQGYGEYTDVFTNASSSQNL